MTNDEQGQSYVVDGASIECSAGTSAGRLSLSQSHQCDINGKAVLNIKDSQSMVNIGSMGQCKNKKNAPCVPAPSGEWQRGKDGVGIDNTPALLNTSIIPCGNGGIIKIVADGQ